jgi:hypothetical protein
VPKAGSRRKKGYLHPLQKCDRCSPGADYPG